MNTQTMVVVANSHTSSPSKVLLCFQGCSRAYQLAAAGQVNSIFQGVTALTVIIGIIFFNERNHKRLKIVGAILTTVGIILLV